MDIKKVARIGAVAVAVVTAWVVDHHDAIIDVTDAILRWAS